MVSRTTSLVSWVSEHWYVAITHVPRVTACETTGHRPSPLRPARHHVLIPERGRLESVAARKVSELGLSCAARLSGRSVLDSHVEVTSSDRGLTGDILRVSKRGKPEQ